MNKDNYVIILFNGFNSSKIFWKYIFEGKPKLRKVDFLDQLKKIGKTYTFNHTFFNINYYYTPDDEKERKLQNKIDTRYKTFSSNINFKLEDLDYKNICDKTYNIVKKKYGNKKYIVIGHSYGGGLALLFSKLYKNDCVLCCCIDNPPNVLSYFKKYFISGLDADSKNILKKYSNNDELKKSLKIIKTSKDVKEKNKEIDNLQKLIAYKASEDRIKYYDTKLYVPTIFFMANSSKPIKQSSIDRNKFTIKQQKLFEKDKNLKHHIIMVDADHAIWENKELSNKMIETIKQSI